MINDQHLRQFRKHIWLVNISLVYSFVMYRYIFKHVASCRSQIVHAYTNGDTKYARCVVVPRRAFARVWRPAGRGEQTPALAPPLYLLPEPRPGRTPVPMIRGAVNIFIIIVTIS